MRDAQHLEGAKLLSQDGGTTIWSAPPVVAGRTIVVSTIVHDQQISRSMGDDRISALGLALYEDGSSDDCPVIMRSGSGADNYRAVVSIFGIDAERTLKEVVVKTYFNNNLVGDERYTRLND